MLRVKTFHLFLISALLLALFAREAAKDYISYGLFSLLTGGLLAASLAIHRGNRRRAATNITSSRQLMWKRLARNKNAMVGMVVLLPLLGHATWHAYRELIE